MFAARLRWPWFGLVLFGLLALSRLPATGDRLPLPKPLPAVEHPASPARIALGKELFFDPRLSRTDKVACATCHDPAKGFSNGERFATGIDGKPGRRHVPSLFNAAYNRSQFWDGRAATLEEQALIPIQSPHEMGLPLDDLVKKLNAIPGYRRQFQDVFGGAATAGRVAQAITAYERTILSNDTPFDRYVKGDKQALSAAALRGMNLFYGDARCFVCHQGPNLADGEFHNVGILDGPPDPGRRGVTGRPDDQGKFKTPSLREVGRTAPYMHNGQFKTLQEVVQHYNFGGVADQPNDHRDPLLRVLYLNETQVEELARFLSEGLTSGPAR